MVELFKNKYKIKSIRLPHWDYSSCGGYFITICTKNKECFFGDVINGKMELSEIGEIAHKYWNEIPKHYKNVSLDEYVLMPNHIHGIIIINNINRRRRDVACNVSTTMSSISPKPQSLSAIIRSFKSAVTNKCNKNDFPNFSWQPRFYEHIIRNENDLNRIREYIINNPLQWKI